MIDKYDFIAPIYDQLSSIVFGKKLKTAQRHFLAHIPKSSTVLVIGGGTGRIIDWIYEAQPDVRIVYVEASQKMLEYASATKAAKLIEIVFIHGTHENVLPELKADVVIIPFVLDLIDESSLHTFIDRVELSMTPSSVIIVTDFSQPKRWVHRALLTLMQAFFAITTRSKMVALPRWRVLLSSKMQLVTEACWMDGFLCSAVFRRNNSLRHQ
jgi:ubiquinone/menaquinone biosynthesis C-methylase UbiE